jgi:hypothetical protein
MSDTLAQFPKDVSFNPLVGLKSFRISGAGGAWRLFVLAKNLAGALDHIERDRLRAFAKSLGVHDKTFNRWLDAARNLGFMEDRQRMSGEWFLILTSYRKAAKILNCKNSCRVVVLPVNLLFSKGWRAYVFASWQSVFTNNGERLVSQKKQAEITGISELTQRQFNKQAGVQSNKNYAISNIHANGYSGALEFGNRAGLFKYWNKETHQMYLGWRIPDSRNFPLFGVDGSYKTRRTMSLFNRTAEQYAASKKVIRNSDDSNPEFPEMYVFDRVSRNGNCLWIHLPLK